MQQEEEAEEQYSCLEEFFIDSCRYGDYDDAMGCFIDNVDIMWIDDRLNNCIHMVCANGHLDLLLKIQEYAGTKGNNIQKLINQQNQDGNTPLHWAVINNQIEIVNFLLQNGSDANLKNNFQRTPLDESLHLEKVEISGILAKHTQADLNDYAEAAMMNTQVYDVTQEDLEDME